MLIASFRMYEAGPRAASAWRALFARVFAEVGVDIAIVEHRWPEPIVSLWNDPRLGCAFMCGWPFARAVPPMRAIAAPVPAPARYASLPRYCSEFLVRDDSGWTALDQALGHRFGWMAENSQSGFNAPRTHLARYLSADRNVLFSEVRGPYGTPARTVAALKEGEVDIVAVDSFYLDLLRYHDAAGLEGLRTVAETAWTPIPMLVAAPGANDATVSRLRSHLAGIHLDPRYTERLADVIVERFVIPDLAAYEALADIAREAERLPRWNH